MTHWEQSKALVERLPWFERVIYSVILWAGIFYVGGLFGG